MVINDLWNGAVTDERRAKIEDIEKYVKELESKLRKTNRENKQLRGECVGLLGKTLEEVIENDGM